MRGRRIATHFGAYRLTGAAADLLGWKLERNHVKNLSSIPSPKDFERLCADLLQAEGFQIEAEPSVDHSGFDIEATCEYRAHNAAAVPPIQVRWLVQCKHYTSPGKNFGRTEMEQVLNSFRAVCGPEDGLLIILSCDYSETAYEALEKFRKVHRGTRVLIWNRRQIQVHLERHSHLIHRYGLNDSGIPSAVQWPALNIANANPVLLISDQSAFAHDLANWLRASGVEVVTLSHWNYADSGRLTICHRVCRDLKFQLCVLFLGDSFEKRLPRGVQNLVTAAVLNGASLLAFPFCAWTLYHGHNDWLAAMLPVRMSMSDTPRMPGSQIAQRPRKDYGNLMIDDNFAEAAYCEYDPANGLAQFTAGIAQRFGIAHSFEFLEVSEYGAVGWCDTAGNPLLVVSERDARRVAYVNSCCHSCVVPVDVASPLAVSTEFRQFLGNTLHWLLER